MVEEDDLVDALLLEDANLLQHLEHGRHDRLVVDVRAAADEVEAPEARHAGGAAGDDVEEVGGGAADEADALGDAIAAGHLDERAARHLAGQVGDVVAVGADLDGGRAGVEVGVDGAEVQVRGEEGIVGAREHLGEGVDVAIPPVELVIADAVRGERHLVVRDDVGHPDLVDGHLRAVDVDRAELGRGLEERVGDGVVAGREVQRRHALVGGELTQAVEHGAVVLDLGLEGVRVEPRGLVVRAVEHLQLEGDIGRVHVADQRLAVDLGIVEHTVAVVVLAVLDTNAAELADRTRIDGRRPDRRIRAVGAGLALRARVPLLALVARGTSRTLGTRRALLACLALLPSQTLGALGTFTGDENRRHRNDGTHREFLLRRAPR